MSEQTSTTQRAQSSIDASTSTSEKETSMSTNVEVNERNLGVARLRAAKLTDAQKRSLSRLSDDFKRVYNASKISDWVALKLSCCNADEQQSLYALYVAQNERIVTAEIDAVKRNAKASNLSADEKLSFAAAATVANVAALKNNRARIVVRARRSTETVTNAASAEDNARASALNVQISMLAQQRAREFAEKLAAAQSETNAVLRSTRDEHARIDDALSARTAERDELQRVLYAQNAAAESAVSTSSKRTTRARK